MLQLTKLLFALCTCATVPISPLMNDQQNTYIEKIQGYHLSNHVMHKMTSSDIWACALACTRMAGCLSMNVHRVCGNNVCEMNTLNRASKNAILKPNSSYDYFELQPESCSEFSSRGWHRYNSFVFKYVSDKVAVHTARRRCKEMSKHADLASISDKEQDTFITNTFGSDISKFVDTWIGYNDIAKEGAFKWFDDTDPSYSNWLAGEPNGDDQDCTVLVMSSAVLYWLNVACEQQLPFICKAVCTITGR